MKNDMYYGNTSHWGIGVCEDIRDPLQAGRVRIRIFGIHTPDKTLIPTRDLPWSQVMTPVNSASISGTGTSPVGMQVGSMVYGIFLDSSYQQFLVHGTMPGIKSTTDVQFVNSESSIQNTDIEELGLSPQEQVYNIARAQGLSENQASGLLAALDTHAGYDPLYEGDNEYGIGLWDSREKETLREFASSLGTTHEDFKTQVLFLVEQVRGITSYTVEDNNGGRVQRSVDTPGDTAAAITQQKFFKDPEENREQTTARANQAQAAYSSNRNDDDTGSYPIAIPAEELEPGSNIQSEEHITYYLEQARDARQTPESRVIGLVVGAAHPIEYPYILGFGGDVGPNAVEALNEAAGETANYRTHLLIGTDGKLIVVKPATEGLEAGLGGTTTETIDQPERLIDHVGTLFSLGGGETGNDDNLDFDMDFELKLLSMLKEYRNDGNPKPTLTSGTRTEEEQRIVSNQTEYFAATRNKSRHERRQAVDFNTVDVVRMRDGGYLERHGLHQRYGDRDPVHIEEIGVFRDPPTEWPYDGFGVTITTRLDAKVLGVEFVGTWDPNEDSGYSANYTDAQWETYKILVRSFVDVFPSAWTKGFGALEPTRNEGRKSQNGFYTPYFDVEGYTSSAFSDQRGIPSESLQPTEEAPKISDPSKVPETTSPEPETAATPSDTSDAQPAPEGKIELPKLDPFNFPTIPTPDVGGLGNIGNLSDLLPDVGDFGGLGDASGLGDLIDLGSLVSDPASKDVTATGGNADTLNNEPGSYYLDFNNFTGLPSPVITVNGDATGSVTLNELGSATLSLSIPSGGGSTVTANTTSTGQTVIWSLDATTFSGVELVLTCTDTVATERHIVKLLITHDGTTAVATEYGTVFTNTSLATFDVDINSGNVRLLVTAASSNSTDYVINVTTL